ncbi:MAG: inositol monophosphatase family protein [Chlamydiota bacterium]
MSVLEDLPKYLAFAKEGAYAGGEVLKKFWGQLQDVRQKGGIGNLVSEADIASEKEIIKVLQKVSSFPVIAEESFEGEMYEGEVFWAVDPLDGTTNYVHCYPFSGVSIALVFQGRPMVGVVYNPFREEIFTAIKGGGAFCNDQEIAVSKVDSLSNSLMAAGFSYKDNAVSKRCLEEFCQLTSITQGVRRGGSAALELCYTGCGRIDGYWGRQLCIWDIAAGALIVEESGGKVTGVDKKDLNLFGRQILATNGKIHAELSSKLSPPSL